MSVNVCLRDSLRASSPIWASEVSLARTRERGAEERRETRLASLAQIGELARRLLKGGVGGQFPRKFNLEESANTYNFQ